YTLSQESGDYATIVKLFRVSMLAVVVVVVAALFKRQRQEQPEDEGTAGAPGRKPALVPWFLWMFVALVIINSLGAVPAAVQTGLNDISRACLVLAIAALGVKTSFRQLARAGWRPMLLLLVETLWMAGFVLALIMLRG